MKSKKILLVGPIYFKNGLPADQMGKLKFQLIKEGYSVESVSNYRNRFLRLFDTIFYMFFKSYNYDIIIIQCFSFKAFILEEIASLIGIFLNKKIIFTIRGGAFMDFYEKHPNWVKRVFKRVNYITSPSLFLKEALELKGHKILHISNFIDIERFEFKNKKEENRKILWVRAFHKLYRPELAIESFKILKEKYPNISLTMVGPDQGELEKIVQLINKYNLSDSISIVGIVSNDLLPDFYYNHSVFITTTQFESFGVAIFEAASSGIPMVSTSVGEIPYLWKHEYDILLSDGTSLDFANKISEILDNKILSLKLSKNARLNAEKYTWDSIKYKWINLLEII